MEEITCPHCGHDHEFDSDLPNDVVVVLPCPECHNLVVLFRNRAIGLDRKILEGGSFEERRGHIAEKLEEHRFEIAEGIAEVLESGIPWRDGVKGGEAAESKKSDAVEGDDEEPITKGDVDDFVRLELHRIDDAQYFRRTFE